MEPRHPALKAEVASTPKWLILKALHAVYSVSSWACIWKRTAIPLTTGLILTLALLGSALLTGLMTAYADRLGPPAPWLIEWFIDKQAEFLFVPKSQVEKVAEETGAIMFMVR